MTQQRKLKLALSLTLIAALALALVLPFATCVTANAAPPVVPDKDTWVNTYDGTYYDNLNTDLTGSAFRSELARLIGPTSEGGTHKTLTRYDDLGGYYKKTDVDPKNSNNFIMFYTGTSVKWPGNFSGVINREHVWPKDGGKAFPEKTGPGGDLQHIRPCDNNLNSTRGSKSYDELTPGSSGVKVVAENGSTSYGKGEGLCYTNSTFFYPAKGYRGATARILFYLQTRWGDDYNLTFVDGSGSNKTIGKISTLLKWHIEEPPTDQEILRNNEAAKIQGNRNPFIDHPEYAEMIYCNDGKSYNNALNNVVAQYGSYLDNSNPTVQPESITLAPASLDLVKGNSQTVTATVLPAGASQKVNWKTNNDTVATVNNGVVYAVGKGSTTITVTSAVNPEIETTLNVTVKEPELQSLRISPDSLSLVEGGSYQLTVIASPAGASNSVEWSSDKDEVATVSPIGLVTAGSKGSATITATSTVNNSVKATINVTVTEQVAPPPTLASLTISPDRLSLTRGETAQLMVTASPAGTSNSVTWKSQNDGVATVDQSGLVKAVTAGIATITATSTVNSNITQSITVTVTEKVVVPPTPELQYLTISPSELTFGPGDTCLLTVTAFPAGTSNSVTWKSGNIQVATVSPDGLVKAVAAGTATITATSTVNGSISESITVTVTADTVTPDPPGPDEPPTLQSLTILPKDSALTLTQGDSFLLSVTASPAGASNSVTWSSSDSQVADVDSHGNVRAIGAGTAVITATSNVNASVSAKIQINVKSSVPDIPDPPKPDDPEDEGEDFKAAVAAIAGKTSLSDRYDALLKAIEEYNKLSDEIKQTVAEQYSVLNEEIERYNSDIQLYNNEFQVATDFASQIAAASVTAVLLAVAVIVLKRTGR